MTKERDDLHTGDWRRSNYCKDNESQFLTIGEGKCKYRKEKTRMDLVMLTGIEGIIVNSWYSKSGITEASRNVNVCVLCIC